MARVDWILGQALFWLLVVAVVVAGLVGFRRSGAVLAAHQAGLVAGRSDELDWGLAQAGSDLSVWWGIEPDRAGEVVQIAAEPERRSLRVVVRGAMRTLFGGSADLGAGSFQRVEGFYPGPPAEDGWE